VTRRQPKRVVFVVLRGVRTRYLYLEPDWKPTGSNDRETGSQPGTVTTQTAPSTKGAKK